MKRKVKEKENKIQSYRRNSTVYSGFSLVFVIVLIIIVTLLSLLLFSFFRINNAQYQDVKNNVLAELYASQSINALMLDTNLEYDKVYDAEMDGGLRNVFLKKRWGFYDLDIAMVFFHNDTLLIKRALVGNSKKDDDSLALYIGNGSSQVSISDSVEINGSSYFPNGNYNIKKTSADYKVGSVFKSSEFPLLNDIQGFMSVFGGVLCEKKYTISVVDSLTNSFNNETLIICADTIKVEGVLSGNIYLRANFIYVSSAARVENIVMISDECYISDQFSGTLQVFSSKKVTLGTNVTLKYPSVVCLVPEQGGNPRVSSDKESKVIFIGDFSTIIGEVYGYAGSEELSLRSALSLGVGVKIVGGIYCNVALLTKSTKVIGSVYCAKTVTSDLLNSYINLLKNIYIDKRSLPAFYSYSIPFPIKANRKIVTLLN